MVKHCCIIVNWFVYWHTGHSYGFYWRYTEGLQHHSLQQMEDSMGMYIAAL